MALGQNLALTGAVELVTEVGLDLPRDSVEVVAASATAGLIITLPAR